MNLHRGKIDVVLCMEGLHLLSVGLITLGLLGGKHIIHLEGSQSEIIDLMTGEQKEKGRCPLWHTCAALCGTLVLPSMAHLCCPLWHTCAALCGTLVLPSVAHL